jgi:hypothetical protein
LTSAGVGVAGATALIGAYQAGKQLFSKGIDKKTRAKAGINLVGNLAGGVSSAGKLMGTTATGALGVITGSIDVIKGILDMAVANKRKDQTDSKLTEVITAIYKYFEEKNINTDLITMYGSADTIIKNNNYKAIYEITNAYSKIPEAPSSKEYKKIASLASHLSNKQRNNMMSAGGGMLKGGLAIAGGAVILAGAGLATGGIVLGVAAAVGIGMLLFDYLRKKKNRKEVALREFGIVNEQEKYEKEHGITNWFNEKKESISNWFSGKKEEKKKEKSPLEIKLQDKNKEDVGSWYADYIKDKAKTILSEHYGKGNTDYDSIVKGLGLMTKDSIDKANPGKEPKPYPTEKQIALAINGF